MGTFSIWHWLVVLVVVLLLFGGAGKIPRLAGDLAKSIKAFKRGLKEDDQALEKKNTSESSSDSTKS